MVWPQTLQGATIKARQLLITSRWADGVWARGICRVENPIQIKIKGSNFMNTEEVSADLNTVIENENIIKENQEIIKANQQKLDAILTNQEAIQANQAKILANQTEIISLLSK